MDHIKTQRRARHPRETANIASYLTFFYTLKLFRKGFKRDLEENDLYEVLSGYESKRLGDQLEEGWEKQKKNGKNHSVFRLLFTCYGFRYFLLGLMQMVVKSATIILQPRALGKLVSYFTPGHSGLTKNDAYYYAAVLIGVNIVNCVYVHNYHILNTGLALQVRSAFCSFIYRKTLRLSPTRLSDISIGRIVTLMTKDVQSFEAFMHFANDFWIGILKTMIICFMIYQQIGIATIAGVGFFLVIMPLQIYLGSWAAKLRAKMCKTSDERLQITQETLSAIKIIKTYTWEKFFNEKIDVARKREIRSMHKTFYLKFIVLQMGVLSSKIAFYLLIMTYLWLGNNITAEIVYYILTCFQILSHTMSILFPLAVAQTAEVTTSVKRIGNVLKAMETESVPLAEDITIKPKVAFKNVTVYFKEKEILSEINFSLDMGVTLITGPVGSGKSFLLKTILRDYSPQEGSIITHGRISYASQEPWLFPSSIRQNILFGEKYQEERYQKVLDVCALRYDFDLLSAGDSTIVEDRGINLSKGQQARINLARAVYKESDIYLLDDCLSALDTHVSDYVFKECILAYLRDKLVILVSHNVEHAKLVDNVIVLNHGQIKSKGQPSDIQQDLIINNFENDDEKKEVDECENDDEETNEETKLITETTTEKKVYHEGKKEGNVEFEVYKKFFSFSGGLFVALAVFAIFAVTQFIMSAADKMMSKWVNLEQEISNYSTYNSENSTEYETYLHRRSNMLNLYSILTITTAVLSLGRSFALYAMCRRASIKLHSFMIKHLIHATMNFFDTNFIGNILNRFSKDLTTIDEYLPLVFYHCLRVFLITVGIVALIATVNAMFLIPAGVFFVILVIIRRYYLPTGRSLKRLDATTRSPMIGHLNATLEGLTTIRAFQAQNILRDEFDKHQDLYISASYTSQCSMRAFAFFLDTLCTFFIAVIVAHFVVRDNDFLAGSVGLAITQAFHLTGTLQWGIRQWADVENQMTSVERVLEYTKVALESKQGLALPDWPKEGKLQYRDVFLSYTGSSEFVLKKINFTALPREKIGIIGRTGAGKSSIIATLFRLYEVEGSITIDGVDTKTLSLEFLRSHISIIPQDPVLFTGTIRENIDPTGQYSDEQIWVAIESAHLKSLVPSLDFQITENGANFSVGQRQLICMARAAIRSNKIIVLDEATANMDPETDALIHETIKNNFAACTVITIAHKLHSIINCDKVIVMEKGEIIEFDEPAVLLQNKAGIFYNMVNKAKLLPKVKK